MKQSALAGFTIAALILVGAAATAAQEPGVNLLVNGGMEGQYSAWNGVPQLQMPAGWEPWWAEWPHDTDWQNLRPEFSESSVWAGYASRVHGGDKAMRYFKGWATFTAGARQTVGGITPGVTLELTAWGHSWHCEDWDACHEDQASGPPRAWSYPEGVSVFMRVGIDPTGGADPVSGNVVWSEGVSALDKYRQFSVRAQARSDRVTAFLWASQSAPAENQDAYWDDASLIVVGPGSASQPSGQQAAPLPQPAATTLPDGTTVHIVQPGDTLSGIAAIYGMRLDDLRALNNIAPTNNLIFSGQKIVVRAAAGGVAAGAAIPAAQEPTATPAPETAAPAQTMYGGAKMLAFAYRGDGDWEIYLADATGAVTQLTVNDADDVEPTWSPDGARLAFTSDRDGDNELYVVNLACLEAGCTEADAVPLTDNDADDRAPAWTPDGAHLLFQSDRDGDWNIYLLNVADGAVARLTLSAEDEVSPAAQPVR